MSRDVCAFFHRLRVRYSEIDGQGVVTFALAIFPQGGAEARATGEIVWVNTDRAAHRAAPPPAAVVEAVAARREGLA